MRLSLTRSLIAALLGTLALQSTVTARPAATKSDAPAPEFTHTQAEDWLNSRPLTLKSLRGQVVLLDFWTFGCSNCYRSFPWLNTLEQQLHARGLRVIGVHTPEFAHERLRAGVKYKMEQFGLRHPVMLDNDFSYWNAFGNRYWPAFYLIDKQGHLREHYAGETHAGDAQARRIEAAILALLAEPG